MKKFLLYFLAFVFHFIPRNKHLWLTGKPSFWYEDFTPPKFFDNSKYFYLYLINNTHEKVFWISSSKEEIKLLKSMNLPVVNFKSIRGIYLVLRAKYFFHHYGTNQIAPRLQFGGTHIDLWHGTPLKKIRYDVVPKEKTLQPWIIRFLNKNSREYVSSTSENLSRDVLVRAFDVPIEQMMNYGYPRTDVLHLDRTETYNFAKKYSKELISYFDECKKFSKTLLYMPTWRDDDPDYFSKANIDFDELNKKLKELNYVFFLKLHPLTKKVDIKGFSNIKQIDNDVDIYPFLNYTDFLITDYSSIYFDYLLTNKEIIFIPYDYENYVKNRELYFDYDKVTPGKKYYSFDDFIQDLPSIEVLNFVEKRNEVKQYFIENYNFNACERIYSFISEEIRK